jgi:hypothetical protein
LYFSSILGVKNLLLVPSPQFVFFLYILFYKMFWIFKAITGKIFTLILGFAAIFSCTG